MTLTAANVALVTGRPLIGTALTTITAGMPLYRDTTTPQGAFGPNLGPMKANAAGKDVPYGIALSGATAGQPITYAGENGNVVSFGAILTVNGVYIAGGSVAGDINPHADITTGWKLGLLGYAKTTSLLTLLMAASEVANG